MSIDPCRLGSIGLSIGFTEALQPSAYGCAKPALRLGIERHQRHQSEDLGRRDIAVLKQSNAEHAVLIPACGCLGHEEGGHMY